MSTAEQTTSGQRLLAESDRHAITGSSLERFDLASRGPWGSLFLIVHLKMRHLAVLGALVTMLALAVDPFTQQIIHWVTCSRVVRGFVALAPRAQNLTNFGIHTGANMAALSYGMYAAIQVGVLDSPQALAFDCATGNCTFPAVPGTAEAYQTLAFDSTCVDISQEVDSREGPYYPDWYLPKLGYNLTSLGKMNVTRTAVGYNPTLFEEHWPTDSQTSDHVLQFVMLTLTVDWDCFAATTGSSDRNACFKAFAVECQIWLAVQTLSAYVSQENLWETVLKSERLYWNDMTDRNSYPWMHLSSKVLRNGTWNGCNPGQTVSVENLIPVSKGLLWWQQSNETAPEDLLWYPQDCIWASDSLTQLALTAQLFPLFGDNYLQLSYGLNLPYLPYEYDNPQIKSLYHNDTANLSTVTVFLGTLAKSMTAYARTAPESGENLRVATCDAIRMETCIRVRWAWISFPAGLVALTFVFLGLTILHTGKHRTDQPSSYRGAWKSYILAVLFAGMGRDVRHEYGVVNTKHDMMAYAEATSVSLVLAENGWKLKGF